MIKTAPNSLDRALGADLIIEVGSRGISAWVCSSLALASPPPSLSPRDNSSYLAGLALATASGGKRAQRSVTVPPWIAVEPRADAASSANGRAVTTERDRRLPDPDVEHFAPGVAHGRRKLVVDPLGEHFDGNRLGTVRPDEVQILVGDPSDHLGEGSIENVEVAHPALAAQPFTLDDQLNAVVVSV
jgi:hypothetical protein